MVGGGGWFGCAINTSRARRPHERCSVLALLVRCSVLLLRELSASGTPSGMAVTEDLRWRIVYSIWWDRLDFPDTAARFSTGPMQIDAYCAVHLGPFC